MYYVCYVLLYCIIFAFGAAIGSFLNVIRLFQALK